MPSLISKSALISDSVPGRMTKIGICRLNLSRVTSCRAGHCGVVINHPVIRKIVSIVATSMENRHGCTVWSYLWAGCAGFIHPNALSAAVDAKIT